jgi:PAS domain S-box-containing protein
MIVGVIQLLQAVFTTGLAILAAWAWFFVKRRTAEAAEHHAEVLRLRKFERLVSMSLDCQFIANYEGYFTYHNRASRKVLGLEEAEVGSVPFIQMVHPEDQQKTLEVFANMLNGRVPDVQYFENRYKRKDGVYIWLMWSATTDPVEKQVYAVARDVTPLKQMQVLERERDAAEATARAKSQFLVHLAALIFVST